MLAAYMSWRSRAEAISVRYREALIETSESLAIHEAYNVWLDSPILDGQTVDVFYRTDRVRGIAEGRGEG